MAKGEEDIKKALLGIEKVFGKGSVMRMGDKPEEDIEVISTSSLLIDRALGVGGLPKGRIIEIMGNESSGKCFTEDAYIQTPNGYKTAADIFEENGKPLLTVSREEECVYPLINRYGEVENTTHFTYNGKRTVNQIETQSGYRFKRTYKHPLMTMSESGNLVWKWSGEISVGDYVVNHRKVYFGEKKVDPDVCYSIGALIADGNLTACVGITNDDPCIKEFIENRMTDALGFGSVRKRDNNCASLESKIYTSGIYREGERRGGRKLQEEIFDRFEIERGTAKNKKFPKWVMELNKESMAGVIRGYIDCESYIDEKGLEVTSASYELLYQLKLMLSQFGITSFLKEKVVKGYEHNQYYRINIYSEDFDTYIRDIGTRSKFRESQISKFLDFRSHIVGTYSNYKHIPNIQSLLVDLYHQQESRSVELGKAVTVKEGVQTTHEKLKGILELVEPNDLSKKLGSYLDYTFEKVVSNERLEEPVRTFDFSMEKTHSFVADGCINHNTTLTLHVISELQKQGGTAAFIDAEHALDPTYARALGVNTDNLILSQPDYGEQALEILDKLIDTKVVDLIIVDSVAALTPKAELDGEMEDNQMGLQARLMSKAMRKITSKVHKSNVTVIFINQFRSKIGIVFGNPEVTTGGNALKFYSSVRMEIRKSTAIKDGEEVIGNKTKIKIIKNKVAPPFRTADVEIIYGKGIDSVGEILTLAVDFNIIEKKGSWFSYAGVNIAQGREGTVQILRDNEEMLSEIKAKVLELM